MYILSYTFDLALGLQVKIMCVIDELYYAPPLHNINRGWDTQSPMPIGKLVFIYKAMGICLIFVNIEVQSKLFNHTCLEAAVYCVPYRLGSYMQ